MKISVYQTFNGYRVVAGNHLTAREHTNIQPRVYSDAATAYSTETDDKIRASILRIDPTAADGSTLVTQHHAIKESSLRYYIRRDENSARPRMFWNGTAFQTDSCGMHIFDTSKNAHSICDEMKKRFTALRVCCIHKDYL